jgi:uncharacterized repeat protein (TIGR01451 family)
MKYYLLLALFLFSLSAFGQNLADWEALPQASGFNADLIYQTQKGYLIAEFYWTKENHISKDNGKNWTKLVFQDTLYNKEWRYDHIAEDENGNLYITVGKKLFKSDSEGKPLLYLTTLNNYITGIAFRDKKMFLSTLYDFQIWKIGEPVPTITFNTNTHGNSEFVFGPNGKYYFIGINGTPSTTFKYAYLFDSEGKKFQSQQTNKGYQFFYSYLQICKSGRWIGIEDNNLIYSDDEGTTTQKMYCFQPKDSLKPPSYWRFLINEANEILVLVDDKLMISKDEGKTWETINTPNVSFIQRYYLNNNRKNQIILSNYDFGTFITEDNGTNWKQVMLSIDRGRMGYTLTKKGNIINVTNSLKEYFNKDSLIWVDITNKNELFIKGSIHIFPSGKWLVLNDENDKYYTSTDKGKNWVILNNIPKSTNKNIKFANGDLYILETDFYFISKDEGKNWNKIDAIGLKSDYDFNEEIFVWSDTILFTGYYNSHYNLFNYIQSNKTQEAIKLPFNTASYNMFIGHNKEIYGIISYYDNYGRYNVKMFITRDFGKTFQLKTLPKLKDIEKITLDLYNNIYLFYKNTYYVSYDDGDSWENLGNTLIGNGTATNIRLSSDQFLYAVYNSRIYKTKLKIPKKYKLICNVFLDKNNNCQKDFNEPFIENIKIKSDINTKLTNNIGSATFYLNEGVNNISPLFDSYFYKSCQTSYLIDIKTSNNSNSIEIPLQLVNHCAELQATMSIQNLRRCFSNTYAVLVCNQGTKDASNSKITITLDSLFEFEKASLPIISKNGKTIVLDAGTIKVNDCQKFTFDFKVSCDAKIGQLHCIKAICSSPNDCNDPTRASTEFTECMRNIGSYDPNDKTAFVNGVQNVEHVKAGQKLEYLVRFQNTGTDTAFTVVIKDSISANLDVSSIVMGASSHRYTWEVKENVLIVSFNNIMLPDSNKSERNSHGFIKFKINPKPNIGYKDIIENTAAIYFDYNAPVFTNKVILNQKTLSVKSLDTERLDFSIFPNPSNEFLHLQWTNSTTLNSTAFIYALDGRLMTKKDFTSSSADFDLITFPPGIYIIKMRNDISEKTKRFVKF